jgi:anti-sigma B factor antagonist
MDTMEKQAGNVTVISFTNRLDALAANDAEKKLGSLVNKPAAYIVIDLSKLEYISSSGLRVFLAALKKVRSQGGDIRLACLQPYVKEVFDIAGFTTLFKIFEKEEDAVNSYTGTK